MRETLNRNNKVELIFRLRPVPEGPLVRFLSTRKLSRRETKFFRANGIKRYCLPRCNNEERDAFFREFDRFWGATVSRFDHDHPFWRNVVSSKMQEWENSAAYLALVLFTLTRTAQTKDLRLFVISGSLEEERVIKDWGRAQGWTLVHAEDQIPVKAARRMKQEMFNAFKFIYYAAGLMRNKLLFSGATDRTKGPGREYSTLIASLSYPGSFRDAKYNDPFFGDLHTLMAKNDAPCLYLCDFLTVPDGPLAKRVRQCREGEVVFPFSVLSFAEIWAGLWRVLASRMDFSGSDFMGVRFGGLLSFNARRFTYAFNIHAQMYYAAVNKLFEHHRFNRLLYIFEGNVFERACIQAFRRHSDGRIDGYSHNASQFDLNMKLHLSAAEQGRRPEPDRFICPGPISKRMLSRVGGRADAKLDVACSLKDIPNVRSDRPESLTSRTVLVGLEGFTTNINLLDWLLENHACFKGFDVLLREHPNMPVRQQLEQCVHPWPEHWRISDEPVLEEDIKRSFCVLYRGTSIGMQALYNKVPVIHLAVDTPLSADPMEEITEGRWVVRQPGELSAVLQEIQSADPAVLFSALDRSSGFAKDYFTAPSATTLKEFTRV